MEAGDREAAVEKLLADGLTPVSLSVASAKAGAAGGLKDRELADFARDLSHLLGSDAPVPTALRIMQAGAGSRRTAELIRACLEAVEQGGRLHAPLLASGQETVRALGALVRAGEASGQLPAVLQHAAMSLDAAADVKDRISGALAYPLIVLFMTLLTLAVFFGVALPRLRPLLEAPGMELPWLTAALLAVADAAQWAGPLILILILVTYLLTQANASLQAAVRGAMDRAALGPLGFRVGALTSYAGFSRACAMMLSAGVALPAAVESAAGSVRNGPVRAALLAAAGDIRGGGQLSRALSEAPAAPAALGRMIAVGERTGRLDAALGDAAQMLSRQAEQRLGRATSLLAPALTVLMGLFVAVVVGALFLGLASITDSSLT